ncbi:MAG: hypothetical protein LBF62_02300 [Tannerellaceae bacterium]|jgi:hypothetical protein|nr:hypothetical protein [Tannerellaceae bacterium]
MQLEETCANGWQAGPYKQWTEDGQLSKEGESARSGTGEVLVSAFILDSDKAVNILFNSPLGQFVSAN